MSLLGLEIVLIATFWVYRTVRVIRELSSEVRRLDRPHVGWQVVWAAWLVWLVALVAAGLALTSGNAIGLPVLAIAMVGMFGYGVWNAWVLISEVSD